MSDCVTLFETIVTVDTGTNHNKINSLCRRFIREYYPDWDRDDENFKKLRTRIKTLASTVEYRRSDQLAI